MHVMSSNSDTTRKAYSSPKLNKLSPEQAKLVLIGHATSGDLGARDLLSVIYPDVNPEAAKVSPFLDGERPKDLVTHNDARISRSMLPAWIIPKWFRESFRRRFR
jgi:hypothetical protein